MRPERLTSARNSKGQTGLIEPVLRARSADVACASLPPGRDESDNGGLGGQDSIVDAATQHVALTCSRSSMEKLTPLRNWL